MAKLKNWKEKDKNFWKNTEEDITVKVQEGFEGNMFWDVGEGEYAVTINTPIETTPLRHDNQLVRIFQNIEEASEEAKKWMKDYPDPDKEKLSKITAR